LARLAEEAEYARRYTKAVNGAIQILVGLQDALDFSDDEFQIAENLDKIYNHCMARIGEADATRDTAIFDEVIGHLKTLKEAWDEIAKQEKAR
jgi:flagellar protein FliS